MCGGPLLVRGYLPVLWPVGCLTTRPAQPQAAGVHSEADPPQITWRPGPLLPSLEVSLQAPPPRRLGSPPLPPPPEELRDDTAVWPAWVPAREASLHEVAVCLHMPTGLTRLGHQGSLHLGGLGAP